MIRIISVIIIVFSLYSCNDEVKEIEMDIRELGSGSIFCLDTMNTSDWNHVYISKPYDKLDLDGYNIPEPVLKKIEQKSMSDGCCSLLFLKDKQLVNYSFIPRDVADFSELENKNIYPSRQKYKLSNERVVITYF